MKSYGYFFLLNHIALAVDRTDVVEGFKDLVQFDMFNRASIFVLDDAEPKAKKLVRDLTQALYPCGDAHATVAQRMMLVRAILDQELDLIIGGIRLFVPYMYTKEELCINYGFFDDGNHLRIPYFLRMLIVPDQAVFYNDRVTSFSDVCTNGEVTRTDKEYGLFPGYVYGHDNVPEKFQHLQLF